MKLQPLHDWAVIRQFAAEEVTASGLYIPDTAKEKPYEGVVLAIGPGAYEEEKHFKKKEQNKERRFIATTVKPGDRVVYERFAGRTHTIDANELVLVRERDILGILPEKPAEQRKPLQIPAATSSLQSTTAILKRPAFPLAKAQERPKTQKIKKKAKKKNTKKTAKKIAVKKAAKKTAKKTLKKTSKKIKCGSSKSGKSSKKH